MNRFYVERIQKARLYTDKTFHFLVSLQCLVTWGLGPEPSVEALAHEITTRTRELFFFSFLFFFFFFKFLKLMSFSLGMVTMKENKGKEVVDEAIKQGVQS